MTLESRYERLCPRERQIADLLFLATPNKVMAVKLDLGLRTVEQYVASVCRKLGAKNRCEAIKFICAIHWGCAWIVGEVEEVAA